MQRRDFHRLSAAGLGAIALPTGLLGTRAHAATSVGLPAPDFTLNDTAGRPVRRSQFRGQPMVLEWTNPGCPFVRKHYQGNLQTLQRDFTQRGVAWLVINSTRDDSPDYLTPPQLGRWMTEQGASPSATLLDEDGRVGKRYGARVTPHMYIINAQGMLVYVGAIDNIPSARASDIDKATNLIRQGLDELLAGKPLSVSSSQAYGCSIKYKT